MPNFHDYRSKPETYTPYARLWHWHDEHPLPTPLNKAAREGLYWARLARQRLRTPAPQGGVDDHGDPVVSPYGYPEPVRAFPAVPLPEVEARFRAIHAANEHLYNGDGSWNPHPGMPLFGSGIPLEEIADRILGYLGAYEAFGEPVYLQRAEQGGRYLLERRLFASGHLRLEGHHVIELEYGYAGAAFLALWERDRSQTVYAEAARRIGHRLVEEHIGGAVDHALKATQVLAPLSRITGNSRFLKASLRRAFRAVRLQLPYGGWAGADSRIWYHCIIARGLLDTYVATPNTVAYYAKKDRLARAITAALNRVALVQSEDGHVRIGRGSGTDDPVVAELAVHLREHAVRFTGQGFEAYPMMPEDFVPRDVMDFCTAAVEELGVLPAAGIAHGLARAAMRSPAHLRLEFETYVVGRYASFVHRLAQRSPEIQSRTGLGPATLAASHENGAPAAPVSRARL